MVHERKNKQNGNRASDIAKQAHPEPLALRMRAFVSAEPRHTHLFQAVDALTPPLVHVTLLGLGVYLQWPRKHGELRAMNAV